MLGQKALSPLLVETAGTRVPPDCSLLLPCLVESSKLWVSPVQYGYGAKMTEMTFRSVGNRKTRPHTRGPNVFANNS